MARPLAANRFVATLPPLPLDELDKVAGGLQDPDQNQLGPDAGQTGQTADGAAFEQTRDTSPEAVQDRFEDLQNDFNPDRSLQHQTPEELSRLSHDIADGLLDHQLGTLVDMVGRLNPANDAREIAQIASGLLDRYADGDRPGALAGLLDQPAFQPNKLMATTSALHGADKAFSIELLDASANAFEAAGRTADASRFSAALVTTLTDVMIQPFEDNLIAGLMQEGAVSPEAFRDAFLAMQAVSSTETSIESYRELAAWVAGDDDRGGEAAIQVVHQAMVQRLTADADAAGATAAGLAGAFAHVAGELEGLDLTDELSAIYIGRATAISGALPEFIDQALANIVAAGIADADFSVFAAQAYQALLKASPTGGAWQMIDSLLDLPATDAIDALLTTAFVAALKTDPNPAVAGRLMNDGVVTPPDMIAGLLANYNIRTDTANGFASELAAIAKEAGSAAAAFQALIPGASFSALVKEAADRQIDIRELILAANLLVADPALPIEQLPASLLPKIFTEAAGHLQTMMWNAATMRTTAPIVHDLLEAHGLALMTGPIMTFVRAAQNSRADVIETIRIIAGDASMALVLTDLVRDNLANYRVDPAIATAINGFLAAKDGVEDALGHLAKSVASGDMTEVAAAKLMTELWPGTSIDYAKLIHADVAVARFEAGEAGSAAAMAALAADLNAVPSPLLTAVLQAQNTFGLTDALEYVAKIALEAHVDVGSLLARVQTVHGVDVTDAAARTLGAMIADGTMTAEQALAAARTAYRELEIHEVQQGYEHQYYDRYYKIGEQMGFVRLAGIVDDLAGTDAKASGQLQVIRDAFMAQVASGQVVTDAISQGTYLNQRHEIMELISLAAEAAGIFSGSLYIDVLGRLGMAPREIGNALREELSNMLTDPNARAGLIDQLHDALTDGRQSAASITAELELLVEHASAYVPNRPSSQNYDAWWATQQQAMRDRMDGVDRLIAGVALQLLAEAPTSAAARDRALDWFSAQSPSGQLAILKALPAGQAETGTLRAISAVQLDTNDWTAQALRTEQTIGGNTRWDLLKEAQASRDIGSAVTLALLVGESPLKPLVDMARAWGVLVGDQASYHARQPAFAAVAQQYLGSTAAITALALSLANAVKNGEATVAEVSADIEGAVGILRLAYQDSEALEKKVDTAFLGALVSLGLTGAAAQGFLATVNNGEAFAAVDVASTVAKANAEVDILVNAAKTHNVSVDYVLTALYKADLTNTDTMAYIRSQLASRIDSGAAVTELLREIGQGDLSASKVADVLRDATGIANRSFGVVMADLVEGANTAVQTQLRTLMTSMGAGMFTQSIGADVALGRTTAANAAASVYEIARFSGSDPAAALARFVSGAGQAGTQAAVEAVKFMDDIYAALGSTPAAQTVVSTALDSIRATLVVQSQSLATADMIALNVLADLYVKGAVDPSDIGILIDKFDGTVPDVALIALYNRLDALADTATVDQLQLVVAQRLADRVASGALFDDAMEEIRSVYYSGQPDSTDFVNYQRILDRVERSATIAAYASYYQTARQEQGVNQAHAAAEAMIVEGAQILGASAAYTLYMEARAANAGHGSGFNQWIVNQSGQANRDIVLGGLALEMASWVGADGSLPADKSALQKSLLAELMNPENREAAAKVNAALPADKQRVAAMAAGEVAREIAEITGKFVTMVDTVTHSQTAAQVLTGDRTADMRDAVVEGAAFWLVAGGTLAKSMIGGPVDVALSLSITGLVEAMRHDAFRNAIGSFMTPVLEAGLKVLAIGKSVLYEAAEAFAGEKIDAAIGTWTGSRDFFTSLASGNMAASGDALLKFADNLSNLINVYDMRAQFGALKAGLEQAVVAAQQFYTLVKGVTDHTRQSDIDYTRTHTMGISFLPT